MPTPLPPIEHRFTSATAPRHTQKGPYLLPLLKKFLKKKIDFEDPDTKRIIHGRVKDAIIWRLILNATQGENEAIKEILNRVDGKVAEEVSPITVNLFFEDMMSKFALTPNRIAERLNAANNQN